MELVGQILSAIGGLGSVVCFILVVVRMIQKGAVGLGIACIVLALCCCFGGLIAYIYGWIKSGEWDLRNVMLIWTVCFILSVIGSAMNPGQINVGMDQFKALQGN